MRSSFCSDALYTSERGFGLHGILRHFLCLRTAYGRQEKLRLFRHTLDTVRPVSSKCHGTYMGPSFAARISALMVGLEPAGE